MSAISRLPYRRVFSGIQPTGSPHLGNYLGALRPWVEIQKKSEQAIYCIVDLHAITIPQEPDVLRKSIRNMAATLLACGIDPKKSILYQQSTVPEHAELGWLLMCQSPMGHLQRMPQWKLKKEIKGGGTENAFMGLLSYPVLQAADILLYRTTHVPVGEDQLQHIVFSQFLANSFNHLVQKEVFAKPEIVMSDQSVNRIRSLSKPMVKMSKSDNNPNGPVFLDDTPELITKKFRKAVTDFTTALSYEVDARPGVSNLVGIYSAFSGMSTDDVCEKFVGQDTLQFKQVLADLVIENLRPIQKKLQELHNDPAYLDEVMRDGTQRAREHASTVMADVRKAIGFS